MAKQEFKSNARHHQKKSSPDIETSSIYQYLNIKEGTFLWGKNAKNVDKKLVLESFLILVNSPKQPMNAKLFKENYQKNLSFCFAPYSFMDKIMKKSKRSQKLI